MNELPPVRNTLSISLNGTPSVCSQLAYFTTAKPRQRAAGVTLTAMTNEKGCMMKPISHRDG
jgi:hypothetical protein